MACRTTKKPRWTKKLATRSRTHSANRLRRLDKRFVRCSAAGKCEQNDDNAKHDAIDDRRFHAHSPFVEQPAGHAVKMTEDKSKSTNQRGHSRKLGNQ